MGRITEVEKVFLLACAMTIALVIAGLGVGYLIAYVFHHPVFTITGGALGMLTLTCLLKESRAVCIIATLSGAVGGAATFWVSTMLPGALGGLNAVGSGILVTLDTIGFIHSIIRKVR